MRFSIVEELSVTATIARAFLVFERTDDALNAVCFALERDAKLAGFELEDRPGCYWIKRPGKPSIKFPAITALFTVKDDKVNIVSIRIEHDGVIFHSAAFEGK